MNGCLYRIQFNPARIVSSAAAEVDSKSIQERKCFLCPANLPIDAKGIPFGEHYQILVNPFPIFPKHLTVPELQHVEQRILHRFSDMLDLATYAEDYIVCKNVFHKNFEEFLWLLQFLLNIYLLLKLYFLVHYLI